MRTSTSSRSAALSVLVSFLAGTVLFACSNDLRGSLESQGGLSEDPDGGADPGQSGRCPAGTRRSQSDESGCVPCDVGTYCEGGTADPEPCAVGSWDHDADPATACKTWTNCVAGEYVMQDGSNSRDRECVSCAPETFSSEVNSPECRSWTTCEAGSYVRVAGTASRDQVCTQCASGTFSSEPNRSECSEWSDCDPGTYVATPGSDKTDRDCVACPDGESSASSNATSCVANGECEAGTEQVAPATATQGPDCSECEPGQYCAGGTTLAEACGAAQWDDDADPASACTSRSRCSAGSYVSDDGSALSDRECRSCPSGTFSASDDATGCLMFQVCAAGTRLVTHGTSKSDVVCSGCPSGSYSDVEGAETCTPWRDCEPGEFVSVAGSAQGDRECEVCPTGTYSDSLNAGACVELGQCAPGSVEVVPGTDTTPAECEDCNSGEFCAGGQTAAVACADDDWDDDGDPATPCVAKTTCAPGQYVTAAGDVVTDRSCAACADGAFSDSSNADGCQAWATCQAGTYVATPGTSTADKQCEACATGTFSATNDAASCTAWTNCAAPSKYESSAPGADTDRECDACAAPEVALTDNASECVIPVFQMSGGRAVMEAEHYHLLETNGSVHNWLVASNALASGGECMAVTPDVAYEWDSPIGYAPRLDFRVNFTTTGTFYIHVRGDAGAGGTGSDSVYAGIDNALVPSYDFDDNQNAWSWRTQGIAVNTTGQHIVSLWAREDGFCADKIVVSTSATPPTGNGPAESPQG
jgi:hypothetical protein